MTTIVFVRATAAAYRTAGPGRSETHPERGATLGGAGASRRL
jgi:hypothetical protein